jgi:hypothetical protein
VLTDNFGHFEPETVAAYAEHRLNPTDLAQMEAHLAECALCRGEILAVRRIIDPRAASRWRRPPYWAAAAAVVLLMVGGRVSWTRFGPGDGLGSLPDRSHAAPGTGLEGHLPEADGSVAPGSEVRFVWGATAEGSTFRVTVLDERGVLLWSEETGDTAVAMPPGILDRGETYFWYVDALAPDGHSLTSGPRRFVVR